MDDVDMNVMESNEVQKLISDYKAVNRMQGAKIELLNKEICRNNKLIEELKAENIRLKDKNSSLQSIRRIIKQLLNRGNG